MSVVLSFLQDNDALFSIQVPQNVGEGGPFSVSGAQAAAKNCWETVSH